MRQQRLQCTMVPSPLDGCARTQSVFRVGIGPPSEGTLVQISSVDAYIPSGVTYGVCLNGSVCHGRYHSTL